jgi:hypothetical protein
VSDDRLVPPRSPSSTPQELREAILQLAAGLTELSEALDRFAMETHLSLNLMSTVRLRGAIRTMQDRLRKAADILVKDDGTRT